MSHRDEYARSIATMVAYTLLFAMALVLLAVTL